MPTVRVAGEQARYVAPYDVTITLPMPPSENEFWRAKPVVSKKTGKLRSVVYLTEEARAYKETVLHLSANVVGGYPYTGRIAVDIKVYFEDDKRDLTNTDKVLLDCLQKVLYQNDKQIWDFHMSRHLDPRDPRVVVRVSEYYETEV